MRELVVQLSYEYPNMFRNCEGMHLFLLALALPHPSLHHLVQHVLRLAEHRIDLIDSRVAVTSGKSPGLSAKPPFLSLGRRV